MVTLPSTVVEAFLALPRIEGDLSRLLLPAACTIDRLLYFTAHVSGVADPGAPARQHAYLSALSTLPEIEGSRRASDRRTSCALG